MELRKIEIKSDFVQKGDKQNVYNFQWDVKTRDCLEDLEKMER